MADINWVSFGLSISALVISATISIIGLIFSIKTYKARFKPYLTLTQYFHDKDVIRFLGIDWFKYGDAVKDLPKFTIRNVGNGPALNIKLIIYTKKGKEKFNLPALSKECFVDIDLSDKLNKEAKIEKFVLIYKDIAGKLFYEPIIGKRRLAKSNGIKKTKG